MRLRNSKAIKFSSLSTVISPLIALGLPAMNGFFVGEGDKMRGPGTGEQRSQVTMATDRSKSENAITC